MTDYNILVYNYDGRLKRDILVTNKKLTPFNGLEITGNVGKITGGIFVVREDRVKKFVAAKECGGELPSNISITGDTSPEDTVLRAYTIGLISVS
jgi:hypothetical protein